MSARVLVATWREDGATGCVRKVRAAATAGFPLAFGRARTARSVGAYFDLITEEGRLFYGDSFHLGYFRNGDESLADALDAHTDLVAGLAQLNAGSKVLDIGCGLGAPAMRIAKNYGCSVTGVNMSREQVRQGRTLVAEHGLSDRVAITRGDARAVAFADASFDSVLCMEAAGDICVTEADKTQLADEFYRVLRPGGCVAFSDLAFLSAPPRSDAGDVRAVLYHSAEELVTDWPEIFTNRGFKLVGYRDVIANTLPTWRHAREVYEQRAPEAVRRYGRKIVERTVARLERIEQLLAKYGSFPVFCAQKPQDATTA